MNETSVVRVGVIGCAEFAWRKMIPALRRDPRVHVVAVASRDEAKAARYAAAFECEGVVGYDALIERADLDAVYVPVPASLHHHWVARALQAGKHVLAEKPLATSLAAAKELADTARRAGLVLAENVMFVHHGQHQVVKDVVASGEVGELRGFTCTFGIPRRAPSDIRYRQDLGGGALFDVGVYPVRAAQYFLGADLEMLGGCARLDAQTGVDISGSALLATPEGVWADLSYGLDHAYRSEYAIWGSRGRVTVGHVFTPPADWTPLPRIERDGRTRELILASDDQTGNTIRAFVEKIATSDAGNPELEATLRQCALIETIRARTRYFGRMRGMTR